MLDAADSLDSYFAKYYDPSKIPALKRGLEKFGVELRTNADAFLEGEGIGAAFEVAEDGRVRMSLKSNPKFRHVFHELGHFQTYLRMLKKNKGDRVKAVADYLALGKARREVEVWGRWKKHPSAWKRLDKAEKKLERDNYKRYRTMLDSNE